MEIDESSIIIIDFITIHYDFDGKISSVWKPSFVVRANANNKERFQRNKN